MTVDWSSAELSLMGGAWIGSQASDYIYTLADSIGIRGAGTGAERRAAEYIRWTQFERHDRQGSSEGAEGVRRASIAAVAAAFSYATRRVAA